MIERVTVTLPQTATMGPSCANCRHWDSSPVAHIPPGPFGRCLAPGDGVDEPPDPVPQAWLYVDDTFIAAHYVTRADHHCALWEQR